MIDLKRLDEALDKGGAASWAEQKPIREAARAYRDLLANGAEPDYEAAIEAFYRGATPPYGFSADVRRAVDAAVGGRLLVDPPKEEE